MSRVLRTSRRLPLLPATIVALVLALAASVLSAPPASAAPATYVSASWSDRTPTYGQTVTVTGTVNPWRGGLLSRRKVQLLRYLSGTWQVVEQDYLSSSSYRLSFRSDRIGKVQYAVRVPAASTGLEGFSRVVVITTSRRASSISATVSDSRVHLRARVVVTGRVTGGDVARRTVKLYRRIDSGPRLVASTRTNTRGYYAISVPTWHYSHDPVLVRAVATRSTRRAQSQDQAAYVVPSYDPAGSTRQWRPLASSPRFRFNGCRSQIGYRVNPGYLGSTYVDEVRTVAARVQEATGIRMRYLGTTSAVPASGGGWPTDASVVIAFASPAQTRWSLAGSTIARGGVLGMRRARDVRGDLQEITRAGVVLDSTYSRWRPGFSPGSSRGKVLLHELGHVLGLGHVGASAQMLYPEPTARTRWGAGDLAGFRRVGFSGGCVSHPYGLRARTAPGPDVAAPPTTFTTSG